MKNSKTMKCDCGRTAIRMLVSTTTIPIAGRMVPVKNIDAFVCECGEIYFDGPTILKLERQAKKQSAVA